MSSAGLHKKVNTDRKKKEIQVTLRNIGSKFCRSGFKRH